MRFEKFMTEKQIDEELLYKQAKSLDDTVLGENTWLFIEHPLLEGTYYDVTDGINESELDHFGFMTEMLNEKKTARALGRNIDKDLAPDADAEQKLFPYDDLELDAMGKTKDPRDIKKIGDKAKDKAIKKYKDKTGEYKSGKWQSWMGASDKRTEKNRRQRKFEKESGKKIEDAIRAKAEVDAKDDLAMAKEATPKEKWSKELEQAYINLTIGSRKAYHELDQLGKQSYITQYILNGLKTKRTEKTKWGRLAKKGKTQEKIYSDELASFKEQQQFTNELIKMMKKEEQDRIAGLRYRKTMLNSATDRNKLEDQLERMGGITENLIEYAKQAYNKGWFKNEMGYWEVLLKIKAKEYADLKELKDCIKQWSAIESNTKTLKSVDITTVCPKRDQYLLMCQEYADAKEKAINARRNGASNSEVRALIKKAKSLEVTEASNPTCTYCYVEQGREIKDMNPRYPYAKAEKRDQKYQGEIGRWNKSTVDKFNKMGGLRFFSSGDYIEDTATNDQIEKIIADAEKVGLQLKAITKQPRFIKNFGRRKFEDGPLKGKHVFNINMSVDEARGFNLEDAIRIKKEHDGNVNIRVVATNVKDAVKYSLRPEVDVITLLHFSSRGKRMQNQEVYTNMKTGSAGWKQAIAAMKKAHPKENWNKILSKLCCSTSKCVSCPNACGFNPKRPTDFAKLAKGGKIKGL
jgi:hypothetical protein